MNGETSFGRAGATGIAIALSLAALLAGCSDNDDMLPGKRIDVRVPLSVTKDIVSGPEIAEVIDLQVSPDTNRPLPLAIPAASSRNSWADVTGATPNRVEHLALANRPQQIWSVPIGQGNELRHRLTATPIVAGGLIYVMDSQARASAFTTSGQQVWSRSLLPPGEDGRDGSSGGLAYGRGILFATTGYGELHALNAVSGELYWTQGFDAPATLAPAVSGDLVFVVTQDSKGWAVGMTDGRLRWNWQNAEVSAGITGVAAPVAAGGLVIMPYPSGTIQAVDTATGLSVWSTKIGGSRGAAARSSLTAVSGGPVVDGDTVYAANQAGRMSAVDLASGNTNWTVREGSYNPAWPVGGSLFVVSDAAELVRLDAVTGERIWAVPLPSYKSPRSSRRKAVFANFGPVLAGGRIIVASEDGLIRYFDPVSGALLGVTEIAGGAASGPVIVNGVLYILSQDGNLVAFR